MVLTARGPSSSPRAPTPSRALDQPAPRARACRAGRVAATAASPARATARAGASTARRPTSCPATAASTTRRPARTSPAVWGVDPDDAARPRALGVRAARRARQRTAGRALLVIGLQPGGLGAATPRTSSARLRALDFLAVCDFVLSETAALADVVLPVTQWAEETGTMTNLEGRVLLRRAGGRPRRTACAPTWRSCRLAARLGAPGSGSRREPEAVFDELRAGQRGRAGRLLRASPTSRIDGRGRACSGRARRDGASPGTPRLFLDRFATAGRPGPLRRRRRTGRRPRSRDADYPLYLTTGRVLAQYQSGAQTRRVADAERTAPEPVRRAAPATSPPASASPRATRVAVVTPPRARRGAGPDHRHDPRRTRVHAVPLGRRAARPTADQPGARPDLADAGVQGLRGAAHPHRPRPPQHPGPHGHKARRCATATTSPAPTSSRATKPANAPSRRSPRAPRPRPAAGAATTT